MAPNSTIFVVKKQKIKISDKNCSTNFLKYKSAKSDLKIFDLIYFINYKLRKIIQTVNYSCIKIIF